jgi:hypothetical protein
MEGSGQKDEDLNTKSKKDEVTKYFIKEIDIIQSIINRMANNSFLIKGWTITLVVGSLLLKSEPRMAWIAIIPIIGFWGLDAYFLRQERLYRKLYAWVIENRLSRNDYLLSMDTIRFKDTVDSSIRMMFSKTLFMFYGAILVLTIVYIILISDISIVIQW